jgi:hypothetical protein
VYLLTRFHIPELYTIFLVGKLGLGLAVKMIASGNDY